MRAGQKSYLRAHGPDLVRAPVVGADALVEDARAYLFLHKRLELLSGALEQVVGVLAILRYQRLVELAAGSRDRVLARSLVRVVHSLTKGVAYQRAHAVPELLVHLGQLVLMLRLAGLLHQLPLQLDNGLHLLMREADRTEHHRLRQLLRGALHHQHGLRGARDGEVHLALFALVRVRGQHVLTIYVADTRRADGP